MVIWLAQIPHQIGTHLAVLLESQQASGIGNIHHQTKTVSLELWFQALTLVLATHKTQMRQRVLFCFVMITNIKLTLTQGLHTQAQVTQLERLLVLPLTWMREQLFSI